MPTYVFSCESCGHTEEIVRRVNGRDDPEPCSCGKNLYRRFTPTQTSVVPIFKSEYYPTFGKFIRNRHELNDEKKKYADANGSELIEVGNEKCTSKPKTKTVFDERRAAYELERAWKS